MPDPGAARIDLIATSPDAADLAQRLDAFARVCRKRRGLRVARQGDGFVLSIDPARIETVGPVVEAAADAYGLRLRLAALEADVPSAGLEARQSGIWAAIGNAVDEDDVILSRGESPSGDLFRHLRVDDVDGAHIVVDDRPPLVEPTGGGPTDDVGPIKLDDVDWHEGAASEAGQPREHAFTHIGLYLAWLIRHDLHRSFPRDHVRAVKAGEMTGSDIADDVDWKLLTDSMTTEGSAFSEARYDRYVTEYNTLLGEDADYGVPEDAALYARVAPLIDRLYADWVIDDRPGPEHKEPSPLEANFDAMFGAADIPWESLAAEANGLMEIKFEADGSYVVHRMEDPHLAPDLESLVPLDLVSPPIRMSSTSATDWGSSLVNRALKQVGVRPRDAMIASGIGGDGEATFVITLHRVPGVTADRLLEAFAPTIHRPPGSKWTTRTIGSVDVQWADGRLAPEQFHIAYWARDEILTQVSGLPADMEAMIRALG